MLKLTSTLAIFATSACSAAPSESPPPDLSTARFSLRAETGETTDPSACDETGVFYDADGNVIVCYSGGVRVAAGDLNNDGTPDLLVSSLNRKLLPTTHVVPERSATSEEGGGLWVEGAASVALVPDGIPVPAGVDVAPDCDGVLVDPETGDILICMENAALLLPAVQSAREAANRGSKKSGGSSKMEYGGAYLTAYGGAGLDILIGGHGSAAMEGGGGTDVIFGGLGQDDILGAACVVEVTPDGLGVLGECSAYAAKTKATILEGR